MKKLALSVATLVAMSSLVFAGGDIEPVIEPKVNVPQPRVEAPVEASSAGFYVGIAYAYAMEQERAGFAPNGTLPLDDAAWEISGMVLAGYQINDNFAVEARFSGNLDDVKYSGNDISDYDFTNAAVYAKVMYPVVEVANVYALLGYGETTVEDKNLGVESKSDGLQWGVGAAYKVNDKVSVFADYTQLAQEEEYERNSVDATRPELDVGTVNLGVAYKF
ncbi:MAG: porin family protein [Campylobacterales bacterium]|nr:porin family protein [Campylobacterales bacterium]